MLPPNLAKLGLVRTVRPGADLVTIWKTPYPVLTTYLLLCSKCKHLITPYGGGKSYTDQGESWKPGYITSGYRDLADGGRDNSPHRFALALDIAIGHLKYQSEVGLEASMLFSRVGLYPNNGFIHVDLVPDEWIQRYSDMSRRFWVRLGGETEKKYKYFNSFVEATRFAREV